MERIEKYLYLVAFLKKKVREGIKQKNIADHIKKSPTYVNWLVLDKRKNKCVEDEVIEKIADFFKMEPEKLLRQGKENYLENNSIVEENSVDDFLSAYSIAEERRTMSPVQLIQQLQWVGVGIKKMEQEEEQAKGKFIRLEQKEKLLEILKQIFSQLYEGVTFFNTRRELVYSSNRWNLLGGIELGDTPISVDAIMLRMRKMIVNFDETEEALTKAYEGRVEGEATVKLINGKNFLFRLAPIFLEDEDGNPEYQGMLLINTPVPESK